MANKEKRLSRRYLAAFGIGGALFAVGSKITGCGGDETIQDPDIPATGCGGGGGGGTGGNGFDDVISETIVDGTTKGYSQDGKTERTMIPSACWQCVARDGIVAHVEDGRLVHLEGNPKLKRTNGKLCARGQGGVGQVYDPDRLLFPMKRTGSRGDGKYERITWDAARTELEGKMREPLTAGTPGRMMFHYGRMKAANSKLIKTYFLTGYGTKNYAGHTAICESCKWTGQELVWGKHYDINDMDKTKFIVNFGCNMLATHTNHLALSQRTTKAIQDRNVPMYTFDVRLSNTANKSTEWLPIFPGTDQAVLLAMAHYIITNNLMPTAGKDFINTWTDLDTENAKYADKVAKLEYMLTKPKDYLADVVAADGSVDTAYWKADDQPAGGYTASWAEGISGVPAAKIEAIAKGYAEASPGATLVTYRGAVMHFNGTNTERVAQMLAGMCGNIETEGGNVHAVGASWKYSTTYPKPTNSTSGIDDIQNTSAYVAASHGASHQVLENLKKMVDADPNSGPMVYFVYCYTPAYANGNIEESIEILKSTKYIPYMVVSDVAFSEAAMYGDLILPDTTYLERWGWEDMVSMSMIPEYYIRQPVITPLGEVEDTSDTLVKLADKLKNDAPGLAGVAAVGSMENFTKAACNDTATVNDAGKAAGEADGFAFMKKVGAYWDPAATPKYNAHMGDPGITVTDPNSLTPGDTNTYIFKDSEGICWETTMDNIEGYRAGKKNYKKYKGQEVGNTIYTGFKPDKVTKSGLFELESKVIAAKHYPALPIWMKVPEHEGLGSDEYILTTFKEPVQTHSRTQNCKYNTEIKHHNPAWINPAMATALGVKDGEEVTITPSGTLYNDYHLDEQLRKGTKATSMKVEVKVTDAIHPKVIAISHSLGHWAYGRYASGNKNPMLGVEDDQDNHEKLDPDTGNQWWTKFGYRGNWIIPNAGDPLAGGLRFFDPVVKVAKA